MIIKSPRNGNSMNGHNILGSVPHINSRKELTRGGSIRCYPSTVTNFELSLVQPFLVYVCFLPIAVIQK